MIKAVSGQADRPTVFLGLSRENTVRLLANQPIRVRLRHDLHPDLPDVTVVLLAGETEADIVKDLRVLGLPGGADAVVDPPPA